jgi:hypothetical protein
MKKDKKGVKKKNVAKKPSKSKPKGANYAKLQPSKDQAEIENDSNSDQSSNLYGSPARRRKEAHKRLDSQAEGLLNESNTKSVRLGVEDYEQMSVQEIEKVVYGDVVNAEAKKSEKMAKFKNGLNNRGSTAVDNESDLFEVDQLLEEVYGNPDAAAKKQSSSIHLPSAAQSVEGKKSPKRPPRYNPAQKKETLEVISSSSKAGYQRRHSKLASRRNKEPITVNITRNSPTKERTLKEREATASFGANTLGSSEKGNTTGKHKTSDIKGESPKAPLLLAQTALKRQNFGAEAQQ